MNTKNLKGLIPDNILAELGEVLTKRTISKVQLCSFLSETMHESNNFKTLVENLNYSAQGLADTFPSRYAVNPKASIKVPNALALKLNRKPEQIANNCYSNRGGNGSELSGDGWKYRGRGGIQLTMKNNYVLFDATVPDDITNNPDLVATKYPLTSAFFYFDVNKLWVLASDFKYYTQLTKRINGGTIGLDKRVSSFNKLMKLL